MHQTNVQMPLIEMTGSNRPVSESTTKPVTTKYEWPLARLFGKNNWCLPWLIELCETDGKFFTHLVEQRQDYIHFLCVVRNALLELDYTDASVSFQAVWLRTHKKKDILETLLDPVPQGLAVLLKKLGPHVMPQNYYQMIPGLLANKTIRNYLVHKKRIHKCDFDSSSLLITLLNDDAIVPELVKQNKNLRRVNYYIRIAQAINPHLSTSSIVQNLMRFKRQEQFAEWIDKQLLSVKFPAPVWPGNDWIHPVTTAAELKFTARKFRNCCYDYLTKVIYGRTYFYVSEEGPAIILLIRDAFLGWEVDEIKGIANEDILENIRTKILCAFKEIGINERCEYRWNDELDDYVI